MNKTFKLVLAAIICPVLFCSFTGCAAEKDTIELEGNPTTGYEWVASSYDSSVIDITGDYEQLKAPGDCVGVGGIYTFTVTALAPGETDIVLLYMRSWEGEESAISKATYHVSVDSELDVTVTKLSIIDLEPKALSDSNY